MKESFPTLKDIAAQLGVSVSTVSRALHGHPAISEPTKKRITAYARKMGYLPDAVAQGLKKRNTQLIGIIVPEIRHDFFSSAIDGIEDIAYKKGYTVLISKSNENYEREVQSTRIFTSNRVAGVIASVSQYTADGEHFSTLMDRGIPVVLFDRVLSDFPGNKVIIDDFEASYNAVSHLAESGYKKIAHLTGPGELSISQKRKDGYLKALSKHNLEIVQDRIVTCDLSESGGETGIQTLIENNLDFDAVFAINDPVAVGAHRKLLENQIAIPEEVGIVGFSNNPVTKMMDPPLTTTDQHGYELGRQAAKILLENIDSGQMVSSPQLKVIPGTLIVRKSSKRGVVDDS